MGACACKQSPGGDSSAPLNLDPTLLMIGAGSSGKSTFLKQVHASYKDSTFLSKSKRKRYVAAIHSNIFDTLRSLFLETKLTAPTKKAFYDLHKAVGSNIYRDIVLNSHQREVLEVMWEETKSTYYARKSRCNMMDNFHYFINKANLSRILDANYMPTLEDIIRCNIRTTGIVETKVNTPGANVPLKLLDLGGQRGERSKWSKAVTTATAVCFVASIGSYDEVLHEDPSVNRVHESINLFGNLVNSTSGNGKKFSRLPLVLLLTKTDQFNRKMGYEISADAVDSPQPTAPLAACFEDYDSDTFPNALDFVAAKYKRVIPEHLKKRVLVLTINLMNQHEVQKAFEQITVHINSFAPMKHASRKKTDGPKGSKGNKYLSNNFTLEHSVSTKKSRSEKHSRHKSSSMSSMAVHRSPRPQQVK